jgi:phage shock protein PspC (stress-responsive transcriptional regulator)
MKKIININLSGRVIPIEDSAYEKLQGYIESLRRYFSHEEGRDEIINDIESRIAELMSEKVRKGATSVTDADIDEIIASMGRPEDFDAETEEPGPKTQQQSQQTNYTYAEPKKGRSRLSRDSSDKLLGGVCSGIANYLNVDPAIIRLLFAIVTFGGFGFGILLYILLWIVLPARDLDGYEGKRLYRNPEERVLGGVASGLAAYFNKDIWVVRLIFAAPLLLNILLSILAMPFYHGGTIFPNIIFGSLTGTFILAYIVLWIVLPEARSQYQKMEMRGEKVDVNTIRQNVKDELQTFKGRAKEFGEEVKTTAQQFGEKAKDFANTRGKTFVSEVGQTARRGANGLGHMIAVLFKAFFLFVVGTIAFGLFVGLMALIFGGVGVWPLKNYVLNDFWQNAFAWGTLLFFLAVPLIAFITWLIRRMMNVKSQNRYIGWTFGGLWALGWVSASLFAASIANDFHVTDKVDQKLEITQPPKGRMIIQVNEPEVKYSGNFWWFHGDENGWDINEDTLKMSNVKIRIEKSQDSNYYVNVVRYSAGKNGKDARDRAQKIGYNIAYNDSVLNLGSGFAIDKDSKFRLQRLMITIKVPVGKKIRFDESVNWFHTFNISTYQRNRWNHYNDNDWDWGNYFDWDTNVDYVMTPEGELVNPNKPKKSENDNQDGNGNLDTGKYRYQNDTSLQKQIEYQKQKTKEEQQKLKDLEQKLQNKKKEISTTKQESLDDEENALPSSISSPVYTLVKFFN